MGRKQDRNKHEFGTMKKIMRWFGLLGLLLALSGVARANTLNWSVSTVWSNHNATAALYSSSPAAEGSSYLVQLIYAGLNGVDDLATNSNTTGVTGDDVVVAYKWVGFAEAPANRNGEFSVTGVNGYANTHANGSKFYIRAWEGTSTGGNGTIPLAGGLGGYFGDSALYAITNFAVGFPETFEAGASQPAWLSIAAIPEVGTGASVFAILMGMAGYHRLRRWRK